VVTGENERVTAIRVFAHGTDAPRTRVEAGRIGKLWGLTGIRIGDVIGEPPTGRAAQAHFAPPTLETVVTARRPADRGALHTALTRLAEQDPLIGLRRDGGTRQEIAVSLYGEVQKEVIQATLAQEFGVDGGVPPDHHPAHRAPAGRRRGLRGQGEGRQSLPGHGGAAGGARSGRQWCPVPAGVELGSLPYSFFTAVEETVAETLGQGLHGWQVTDCLVTMTHSGYNARRATPRGVRQEHVEHVGRFPRPDPAGADGGPAAGRDGGVRADAPLPAGAAGGPARYGAARAVPAAGGAPSAGGGARGIRAGVRAGVRASIRQASVPAGWYLLEATSRRPGCTTWSVNCPR